MTAPRVLGIDVGFAACGFMVVELAGARPELLAGGVLRTKKETTKAKLLAVEDNVRRVRELVGGLEQLLTLHEIRAVAAESLSFPRSASVAAKVAMVWGAIVAICEARRLPLLQCTPQAVKRWATGSQAASKEQVEAAVRERVYYGAVDLLAGVPASLHEHAWDAAACALVCAQGDLLRAMQGAAA